MSALPPKADIGTQSGGMSALCQKRTSPASLEQLIRGGLQWPSYEEGEHVTSYLAWGVWRCLSLRRQPEALLVCSLPRLIDREASWSVT